MGHQVWSLIILSSRFSYKAIIPGQVSESMRLLDTASFGFFETYRPKSGSYAILSHTWSDQEVSLQQFFKPESKQLTGYRKIVQCCELARQQQLEYVWIDTYCIYKTNLVELSEAINSMYSWYQKSAVCYVYLEDLHKGIESGETFTRCRWF